MMFCPSFVDLVEEPEPHIFNPHLERAGHLALHAVQELLVIFDAIEPFC